MKNSYKIIPAILSTSFLFTCAKPLADDDSKISSSGSSGYLYVTSGMCYSGNGNTTFTNLTSSNLVYRIDLASGQKDMTLADYNTNPAVYGDTPISIGKLNSETMYVLVDNPSTGSARRIEYVPIKEKGARTTFSLNTTALNTTLRGMIVDANGDLLINKANQIEKITSNNIRILNGANPYITSPAAPCATSTSNMTKIVQFNNKFIGFIHAAAGQNRIGIVKPTGYSTAGDCSLGANAPNTGSYPTAMTYDNVNNYLIVAYAANSTATDINSIYAYPVSETSTSVTLGTGQKIYDVSLYPATYSYLLYGISDMRLDTRTNSLYVATAVSTATTVLNYAIEKLNYDYSQIGTANTAVLTKTGSTPFYTFGSDTKCISSMLID